MSKALYLPLSSLATIIYLNILILASSKNICSVLQRPTPWAPNPKATSISFYASALVLTCIVFKSLAHDKTFSKSSDYSGSLTANFPS